MRANTASKLRSVDAIHAALQRRQNARGVLNDQQVYAAPEPGLEASTAAIWCEILGVERVGRHTNFFRFGGNSIKAVQVIALVKSRLGCNATLRQLFDAPELHMFVAVLTSETSSTSATSIRRLPRGEPFRLSHAQERIWFLNQLEPSASAYNVPIALRIDGEFRADHLRGALQHLIRRHEALRTSFLVIEGEVRQIVHEDAQALVEWSDIRSAPETAHQIVQKEAGKQFDLSNAPLLRTALIRTADAEHILLLTIHHIVCDGWSIGVLIKELAELHGAIVAGLSPELPSSPIQYVDFAEWQLEQQTTDHYKRQRAYWQQELAGAPPLIELPTDRPRPRVMSYRGSAVNVEFSSDLSRQLKLVASRAGTTLYTVLLAAFNVLLYRYTGQRDICVGTPVAARSTTELEGMVGLVANTVVMRTRFPDPEASFTVLLQQVKEAVLRALSNQDVPFEQVVHDIAPQRSLAHTPIFQVLFALQNTPQRDISLPSLQAVALDCHTGSSKFDLTCNISESEVGLRVNLEYCTDIFNEETICRLAEHYRTLLMAVCDMPDCFICALPLLPASEKSRVLVEWNDAKAPIPIELPHELVARRAQELPASQAVSFADTFLTYAELDARAEVLAKALRLAGASPGSIVGICLGRGPEMIASMLAVWKVGSAYMPLDPQYPKERLAFMISDARPALVLTERREVASLPSDVRALYVDDLEYQALSENTSTTVQSVLEGAAYVIYTSGSTGRPKGVIVSHRALSNFLSAMQERVQLTVHDRWLAVTSLSFDIAGLELVLPLVQGARVVVASHNDVVDGQRLAQLLRQHSVTVMQGTPATWMLLQETGELSPRLRVAICGGEAWGNPLSEYLSSNSSLVFNAYGPTETTIWSTVYDCSDGSAPILGRPLNNTEVYVLDALLQPVPIGVIGDLYIGGAGLADGYLNRPELTAERFIAHPFQAGKRIYRTGDLGRLKADGQILFEGRADHQVKLRGFRIELGEIEAVLQEHPSVSRAAVVLGDHPLSGKSLVGFVTVHQAVDRTSIGGLLGEFLALLRSKLPEYMVPNTVLHLDEVPLTPNGKIDRSVLAALARSAARESTRSMVAPATTTERDVCRLIAEVVGCDRVGATDGFFDLGGASLQAMRLIARVNDEFSVKLSVRELFDNPTARQVSILIDNQQLVRSLTSSPKMGQDVEIQEF